MNVPVRRAVTTDAPAMAQVLRRSITELCVADHGNDPQRLGPWLENKTAAQVATWLAAPDNCCVVALLETGISGVGLVTAKGEITLCYVDPGARFRGVSAALLTALEHHARALGLAEVRLEATLTARRFYGSARLPATGLRQAGLRHPHLPGDGQVALRTAAVLYGSSAGSR